MGYVVHGDGNGLSLSPKGRSQKVLTGCLKGWPDLCVLLNGGRAVWIELKVEASVSREQRDLHGIMRELGHEVHAVKVACPAEGLEAVMRILNGR